MMESSDGSHPVPLWTVNDLSVSAFVARFGDVFEHTPWIAERVAAARPFHSKRAMLSAMTAAVHCAAEEDRVALLAAHPMLGSAKPRTDDLTENSRNEQAGMGLDQLAGDEETAFAAMNLAYFERFGFPFIIAVRGVRDRAAILAAMTQRFEATPEDEQETAMAEVVKIAGFRLDALIEDAACTDAMT
jgi:2-oxo-4-hydroxy-4-carboxy-5-ureidoimidazoline decarboxylase